MNRLGVFLATTTLLIGMSSPAQAGRYDPNLGAFVTGNVQNVSGFEGLARDLGLAFQSRFNGPAHTNGSAGFDLGYAFTMTDIDPQQEHWAEATTDPGNLLFLSQVSIHKGLPYSFGLSTTCSFLHESRLWGLDLGIKWAFVEGFDYVPDMAVKAQVGTMMGSRDLSLLRVGSDVFLSKSFGLGGLVRLTPYAGYSFAFLRAASHVLAVFEPWEVEAPTGILPDQLLFTHRGIVGFRLTAAMIDFGFEAALGETQTYAFRMGLNF